MTSTSKKLRFERKHLLDRETAFLLKQRLSYALKPDENSESGSYRVSSIYFDDQYNTAMYEKMNGCRNREKLRVRYYNNASDNAFLECKEKHGEMINKQREKLSTEQYERLIGGDYGFMDSSSKLLERFYVTNMQKRLRPVVTVEYERQAYKLDAGNVRVTFDSALTASKPLSAHHFTALPEQYVIMELKYDHFLPIFIQDMLGGFQFSQRLAASKYVMARLAIQGK